MDSFHSLPFLSLALFQLFQAPIPVGTHSCRHPSLTVFPLHSAAPHCASICGRPVRPHPPHITAAAVSPFACASWHDLGLSLVAVAEQVSTPVGAAPRLLLLPHLSQHNINDPLPLQTMLRCACSCTPPVLSCFGAHSPGSTACALPPHRRPEPPGLQRASALSPGPPALLLLT